MEIKKGQFMLLPPAPGNCQVCAVQHPEELPHNRDSLYYQFWFNAQYGRSPAWADAMLHCSDEMRQRWVTHLRALGVAKATIGNVSDEEAKQT